MEYLSIGKLKILKNYSKTDGVFVDSSNNEQEGSRYRFLLDGIAKYSLVVEYIKFLDFIFKLSLFNFLKLIFFISFPKVLHLNGISSSAILKPMLPRPIIPIFLFIRVEPLSLFQTPFLILL